MQEDHLLMKWVKAGSTSVPNLLLKHYKEIGMTNDDLVALIQLLSLVATGQRFPDSQLLADRLNVPREEAYKAIHQLMTKKIIAIDTRPDEEGKTSDEFSFDLLYEKLIYLIKKKEEQQLEETDKVSSRELYSLFEEEFGRSLSAMEIQTLSMWLEDDQYTPELIHLALREAVLSQVYSLKYIDRILLSWEKKNIRTKEQVEKETKRHRSKQTQISKDIEPDDKPVPMYNWLKDKKDD